MATVLVIAPHPDDEVLGCGGTIKKHSQAGDEVSLCIVTKAYAPEWTPAFLKQRQNEVKQVIKILGIRQKYTLDFPTVKLDTVGQKKINDAIKKVIDEVKPEIVYIPFGGDLNLDHRLVFQSALVALRPFSTPSVKEILIYETLSETEWGFQEFKPSLYKDITPTLSTKITAMRKYKSELRPYPHPRSIQIIKSLAKKRGSEAGLKAAEAFMISRSIE